MPLLDDNTRNDVKEMLADIAGPAQIIVFTQEFECDYCKETREIAEEIAALSDQITLEVHDFVDDEAIAQQYEVDKIPAIVLLGADGVDYGVRYYGIPSGYEFSSLLHDIKAVAAGPEATELSSDARAYLDALEEEIHLQVFVTPT